MIPVEFSTKPAWNEALLIVWKYDPAGVGVRVIGNEGYIFAQYDLSEVITPQDMARLKELGWFYDADAGSFYQLESNS